MRIRVASVGRFGLRRLGRLLAVGSAARATAAAARLALGLFLGDLGERQHFGFDDAQRRLRAQLAAQQPHGFEVRVDVVGAAADEAGDSTRWNADTSIFGWIGVSIGIS